MAKKNKGLDYVEKQSMLKLTLVQIFKNRLATISFIYIVFVVLVIIFADYIAPYDPIEMHPDFPENPPSAAFLFGTDESGRDILSRVIYGGRISIRVGMISTAISMIIGLPLGLIAGYFGGTVGSIILRAMDIMLAFPGILLALIVVSILGRGVDQVMVAVGIGNIPTIVRVIYSAVLSAREAKYIMAARVIGCDDKRIIVRQILPNVLAPIIVIATMDIASGLLSASSLSFLGLGAQPPSPEWGAMIARGRQNLRVSPWMSIFPGIAIASIVIAFNSLGDALRDAMDPWVRAR